MFKTEREAEVRLGNSFREEQFWRIVELPTERALLHVRVSYRCDQDNDPETKVYLLSDFDDLELLVGLCSDDFSIIEVSLLAVIENELEQGLQMHKVTKVVATVDPETVSRLHICTLDDGSRFFRGRFNEESGCVGERLIYALPDE